MKHTKHLDEFITFVRDKGVLGLAVGIIVGGAVGKLVSSLVDNIINPLIGAITGAAGNLDTMAYTIPLTSIVIKWGAFVSSLIDFTAVLLVVYFVFVKSPINKLDKKVEAK
jgi:large conductance mechanosensitive channel